MGGVGLQVIGNGIEGEIGKCKGYFLGRTLGTLFEEKRVLSR
jgi:hypothetical protein